MEAKWMAIAIILVIGMMVGTLLYNMDKCYEQNILIIEKGGVIQSCGITGRTK